MPEPPRLPQPDGSNGNTFEINPFAPSAAGVEYSKGLARVELGSGFWGTFLVILVACVVAALAGIQICWAGAATILAAAVRVPLHQRRHVRLEPYSRSANANVLLFSSWALMIVFVCVSSISFAVVCVPTALISYGSNSSSFTFAITCGGIASLISFCTLFYLSLRLPF